MSKISDTKRCFRCGVVKATEEFHRSRKHRDGMNSYCKICNLAQAAEWRAENSERNNANKAKWYRDNAERINADKATWRAENSELHRARNDKWAADNPERTKVLNMTSSARDRQRRAGLEPESFTKEFKDRVEDEVRRGIGGRRYALNGGFGAWSPTLSRIDHENPYYQGHSRVEPMVINDLRKGKYETCPEKHPRAPMDILDFLEPNPPLPSDPEEYKAWIKLVTIGRTEGS